MGCYDTYRFEVKCPVCSNLVKIEQQTKAFDCSMEVWTEGDYHPYMKNGVVHVYDESDKGCKECGHDLSCSVPVRNHIFRKPFNIKARPMYQYLD